MFTEPMFINDVPVYLSMPSTPRPRRFVKKIVFVGAVAAVTVMVHKHITQGQLIAD